MASFYHRTRDPSQQVVLRDMAHSLREDFVMGTFRRQPNHMTRGSKDDAECPQCGSMAPLKNLEFLVRWATSRPRLSHAYTTKSCVRCLAFFEENLSERSQLKMDAHNEGWQVACDYCNKECDSPRIEHSSIDNIALVSCTPCAERRSFS